MSKEKGKSMEFIIPVHMAMTKNYRVNAETLEDAAEKAKELAKKETDGILYDGAELNALIPILMLKDEDRNSWPYWSYGYHGNDGINWRQYMTCGGPDGIPSFAEEWNPVPESWARPERG